MKRLLLLLAFSFSIAGLAFGSAETDKPITLAQLPEKAQAFINQNFSGMDVLYVTTDADLFNTDYDVRFSNGYKIEFDKNGDWKSVDCRKNRIPAGIVPDQIMTYVESNLANNHIVEIERNSREYEVKLNNGIELTFDKKFRIIDFDD